MRLQQILPASPAVLHQQSSGQCVKANSSGIQNFRATKSHGIQPGFDTRSRWLRRHPWVDVGLPCQVQRISKTLPRSCRPHVRLPDREWKTRPAGVRHIFWMLLATARVQSDFTSPLTLEILPHAKICSVRNQPAPQTDKLGRRARRGWTTQGQFRYLRLSRRLDRLISPICKALFGPSSPRTRSESERNPKKCKTPTLS
jgi:hypothetical protein